MITLRPAEERGHADHGWLDTHFSFSFAHYYDPRHMGFRSLRVLNEDTIQPGKGFGTHGHDNMEIVTYVLSGALEHQDSTGVGSVLRPGDVQRMSAGSGIRHSEFNHSSEDPLSLLQIWILPLEEGLDPAHEEKSFSRDEKTGRLRLIVSPEGREGSLRIHQDVEIFASILEEGQKIRRELKPERHAWLQVARGSLLVNGTPVKKGDGAALSGESELIIEYREFSESGESVKSAEFLLFDLA